MSTTASQITSLVVVTKLFFKAQIKENIKAPVNSPQKGLVTRKMFPFDDVVIIEDKLSPAPVVKLKWYAEWPALNMNFLHSDKQMV